MCLFSREADTYNGRIIRNFLTLPLVPQNRIAALNVGDPKDIEAKAKDYAISRRPNSKTVGIHSVELRGPFHNDSGAVQYFWIVQGQVNYFNRTANGRDNPANSITEPYCFIGWTRRGEPSFLAQNVMIIGQTRIHLNEGLYNKVNIFANRQRETLYEKARAKEEWIFNNRPIHGIIESYNPRTRRIRMSDRAGRRTEYLVTNFSRDDQELIRAYLDHLNIPVHPQ